MEHIKTLNLYVDWKEGKIYRKKESGFLESLLSIFGKESEYEEVNSKDAELAVKKYKLKELYAIAQRLGKTEFKESLNGQQVKVKIEPDKIIVETPQYLMEYRADKFFLKDKRSGQVQEKEPTLQEFYQVYREIRKLLGAGSVENYLKLKAREPEFKQQYSQLQQQGVNPFAGQQSGGFSWGSALLGLGGGMLLGYLLGSAMGEAFAHEVETAPPLTPEEEQKVEETLNEPYEMEPQTEGEGYTTEQSGEENLASTEDVFEATEAGIPTDVSDDYFVDIDESALDEGSFDESGFADSGEDFGGFDDFGDFDV